MSEILAATAGMMVLVYALLCPLYIWGSPRPRPIILGVAMAILFWILYWTSMVDRVQMAWAKWFRLDYESPPEFFILIFLITLTSSVLAVIMMHAIEHGIARLSWSRDTARSGPVTGGPSRLRAPHRSWVRR